MKIRILTIVCRKGPGIGDFDVHEGELVCDRLAWEEMIGQVASLTHPKIEAPRFRMFGPDEILLRADKDWQLLHRERLRIANRYAEELGFS